VTRCKGCGKDARTTSLAFLIMKGRLHGAKVCRSCAAGGVLLVAPLVGPVIQEKVVRSDGVARALRSLHTFASARRPMIDDHSRGMVEGYESAIQTIRRECRLTDV
jgi:hypothetical protein